MHSECDITDAVGFDRFFAVARSDKVVHCAVMAAVDHHETEPARAY